MTWSVAVVPPKGCVAASPFLRNILKRGSAFEGRVPKMLRRALPGGLNMKLFGFPLSIGNRDVRRFRRLRHVLDAISEDLAIERGALMKLHERAAADAAFAFEALENGDNAERMSTKVDRLTVAMIRSSQRIAALEEQVNFVDAARQRIALLALPGNEFASGSSPVLRPACKVS